MLEYMSKYAGTRILVTGGAGAIGSNLSRKLAELGAQVIILDDLSSGYRWNVPAHENVLFVDGSVTDEIALKRVFAEKPDIVFHLAAFFGNQHSVDYPENDLLVNGFGTLRLLQYAELRGVDRFVYASSGCSIYGSESPLPLREDVVSLHLSTPYQITKMLGELYANFFHHHYEMNVVKPRFFNSYGPGELPGTYRNVIPNFIYWAIKGLPLPITGTGDETRDFTYVDDIIDGLLRAGVMPEAVGHEFNLAAGQEVCIGDLALMINEHVGNPAGVRFVPRRKWDTKPRLLASIDRARDLIGYNPQTTFEHGLTQTVEWFHQHWSEIEASQSFAPGQSSAVRQMSFVTSDSADVTASEATSSAAAVRGS
jgi:UDP-glucose 4-epimerase